MVRPPIQAASWARSSVAEHLTFNQRVDGSIPSGLTSQINRLFGRGFARRQQGRADKCTLHERQHLHCLNGHVL
jgi:hypothetical protein